MKVSEPLIMDSAISYRLNYHWISLEAEWKILQGSANGSIFQTFEWVEAWLKTVGNSRRVKSVILEGRINATNELVFLWPLILERRFLIVSVLKKMGGHHADYGGPLIKRGLLFDWANVAEKSIESLLRASGIDLFFVSSIRPDFLGAGLIHIKNARLEDNSCRWVFGADRGSYLKHISAKFLADTRRQTRRLQDLGNLKFISGVSGSQALDLTMKMIEQKADRYIQTGASNQFNSRENCNFYLDLTKTQSIIGGCIHVCALLLDGVPIAIHWGAVRDKTFYYLMPSYQMGVLSKYSPGKILLDLLFRECSERDINEFDFTVGDEVYKKIWSNHSDPIVRIELPCSLLGLVLLILINFNIKINVLMRKSEHLRAIKRLMFSKINSIKRANNTQKIF